MPEPILLPQTVLLKGIDVGSIVPVLHALEEIGHIFDRAYGMLTIFDHGHGQWQWWNFATITEYRLFDGLLKKKESEPPPAGDRLKAPPVE